MGSCCTTSAGTIEEKKRDRGNVERRQSEDSDREGHSDTEADWSLDSAPRSELLFEADVVTRVDEEFKRKLHTAIDKNCPKTLDMVLSAVECDITAVTFGGDKLNALCYGIEHKRNACVAYLLHSEAVDVNWQRPSDGRTALHMAVTKKRPKLATLLIAMGANPELEDSRSDSPWDLCVRSGFDDLKLVFEAAATADSDLYSFASSAGPESEESLDSGTEAYAQKASAKVMAKRGKLEVDEWGHGTHREVAAEEFGRADEGERVATLAMVSGLKAASSCDVLAVDKKQVFTKKRATTGTARKLEAVFLERSKLPKLEGWLLKKKRQFKGYQKRWIVVKDGYLLWNTKRKSLQNANDPKERGSFTGHLYLLHVKSVSMVDSSSRTKFAVEGVDPRTKKRRKYVFKCEATGECQQWIEGLKAHSKHVHDVIQFLAVA